MRKVRIEIRFHRQVKYHFYCADFFGTWQIIQKKKLRTSLIVGRVGSSVGIANDYGLDRPGSNPGGEVIFRPSRPALGPTQPPVKWALSLSRG